MQRKQKAMLGLITLTAFLVTAINALAYEVWVTNQGINKVQILDGKTLKVIAEITAGTKPHNVTFTDDGKFAWVANVGSNDVSVIDAAARKVVATLPAGKTAHAVTFSPDGKRAYVANPGDGTVGVFWSPTKGLRRSR